MASFWGAETCCSFLHLSFGCAPAMRQHIAGIGDKINIATSPAVGVCYIKQGPPSVVQKQKADGG